MKYKVGDKVKINSSIYNDSYKKFKPYSIILSADSHLGINAYLLGSVGHTGYTYWFLEDAILPYRKKKSMKELIGGK